MCFAPLLSCPTGSILILFVIRFPFRPFQCSWGKGYLFLWDSVVWIANMWSGIVCLVPVGYPKILILFIEFSKLFSIFKGVWAIHLNDVSECHWDIWKWRVWRFYLNIEVFYFMLLLYYAVRVWVSFVSAIFINSREVASTLSLVLF